MEPVSSKHPFDSPSHLFEVKWDGVRMIAFCDRNSVRLQNRQLHDRTLQYPELQVLPRLLGGKNAVLDGEVIAFSKDRPSFFAVMERDACRTEDRVRSKAKIIPVSFMVFDMLFFDDTPITGLPLAERKQTLIAALRSHCESVFVVESYLGSGVALWEATREQNLEGIVGKNVKSPYLQGKKSHYWVKVKHKRRQLCVICGYAAGAGGSLSLLAGAYLGNALIYIGRVASGLKSSVLSELLKTLQPCRVERPPVSNPPKMQGAVWVAPLLTFVCEFAEWTADFKMRAPVFVGFAKEPPEECVIE